MGWESWVIGISVALIAIAFVVLVIFLVKVLLGLQDSLHNTSRLLRDTNAVVLDVEKKLHSMDPLFNAVSNISAAVEKQTSSVKHLSEEIACSRSLEEEQKIERTTHRLLEVAEWALLGVALWKKFKNR